MVIIIVVVAVTSSLTVRSNHSNASNNHGNTYPSRDTDLISYSSKFCDQLSMEGNGYLAEQVMLNLYLLKSKPTNTKQGLITFSKNFDLLEKYEYWFFHLLPNSRIQFNACLEGGTKTTFFLVKGVRNFAKWEKNGDRHYVMTKSVSGDCGASLGLDFTYDVHSSDQYYLIFENEASFSLVSISVNITQVQYVVSPDDVINNCSVSLDSYDSCNLPVAYSSNYTKALLQLEPKVNYIDWEANNAVHVRCHPRAWLYAVISVSSAVGGAILLTIVVAACVFACLWRKKNKVQSNTINTPNVTATVNATPSPKSDRVPLFNTDEEGELQPPPYNDDYNTLPAYKP